MKDKLSDYEQKKVLLFEIENYRFGIKDHNTTFNAMDLKTGIFMSALVVLAVMFMGIVIDIAAFSYSPICRSIILIILSLLLLSIAINLILAGMTLRGREMQNGVVSSGDLEKMRAGGQVWVLDAIHERTKEAYENNLKKYEDKRKWFFWTQRFWIGNLIGSLLFMLVLVVNLRYV